MEKKLRILITGASRGIGYATAAKLCARSQKLFVTAKHSSTIEKAVQSLRSLCSGEICFFNFDQADSKLSSEKLKDWINKKTDYLDAIILCAGDYVEGKIQNINDSDFINNMNTNFYFNYYAVNALIPLLKNSKNPRIIIIGSTAAYGAYSVPTYSVTKWALRGYAKNLRKELIDDGIGVTFISPGGTLTDMWEGVELPPNRLLEPCDIAKVVDIIFDLSPQAVVDEIIIKPILGDVDE